MLFETFAIVCVYSPNSLLKHLKDNSKTPIWSKTNKFVALQTIMYSSEMSKTKRILLKSTKALLYVLCGVLLFVYMLVAVLNTTLFQSFLAAVASDYFSKEWKTKVSIGALEIRPWITVSLKDVYLEDPEGNLVADADYISATLASLELPARVVVSNVYLKDVKYVFAQKNGKINLAFIIDYFKSDKPKEPKKDKKPFELAVDKVKLENIDFSLDLNDNPAPIPEFGVAVNHINFSHIDAVIRDVSVISDSIMATFVRFSATERSGQRIKDIGGKFTVSPKGIFCRDMRLKTDNSDIKLHAAIRTSSWNTYSHFIDSAYCNLYISEGSLVSVKDATYWAPMLKGFDQSFSLSTHIEGTVADAKCEYLSLAANDTKVSLSGSVSGLPDIDNTVFDIALQDLQTTAEGFNSLQFGEMLSSVRLPEMLYSLGTIDMQADFVGLINNFYAKGDITTDIGSLALEAASEKAENGKTSYQCKVESQSFNLGKLLKEPMLGTTSIDLEAKAIPAGLSELFADVQARLDNLHFNGNNYNSVFLDAQMDKGEIDAQCDILDDAIVLNLNCKGEMSDNQWARVRAEITDANLKKINFFSLSDTTALLSTSLFAKVENFDLKNMKAFVDLQSTQIKTQNENFEFEYLNINFNNDSTANSLVLMSDFADVLLKGKYEIEVLAQEIGAIVNRYKPDLELLSASGATNPKRDTINRSIDITSVADFSLKVKDISKICRMLGMDMDLSGGLGLKGKINPQDIFFSELYAGTFSLGEMIFDSISASATTTPEGFTLFAGLKSMKLTDSLTIYNPKVNIDLDGNDLRLLSTFGNQTQNSIGGRLDVHSYFTNTGLQVSFDDSYLLLAENKIKFNDNHLINYRSDGLSFMNFAIVKDNESIVINGDVSDRAEDKLTIAFHNLDISDFNPILSNFGLDMHGRINDKVVLRSLLKDLTLTSNLSIDDLIINDVRLGKAKIGLSNMLSKDEFSADIKMSYTDSKNKQIVPLSIKGRIKPDDKQENLDLIVSMQDFDLKLAQTYLSSLSSYIGGRLSTDRLAIKGKFSQPHIKGNLKFQDAAIKIDMLNTTYSFDDVVYMDDNVFSLKNFVLQDAQKNKITIDGTVSHDNFSSFDLNLKAKADKLKMLDTEESIDAMYYGTVYASADVNLYGNLDFLNIEVAAKTERGTSLTVPLSSKMSANENSYIQFATTELCKEVVQKVAEPLEQSSMGFNIIVELNVNPNAQFFIPMDFNQLKGELSAAGNGDLKIEVGSEKDLSMLGTVNIDNGFFKISVLDMITKAFEIEKGGTLSWSGAPADGVIDLQAVYKTKASLAPILGQEYSKAVDVHSVIKLSGNMTNPQPKFDIRLPNTDANTVERLFMNIDRNDERAMLEQTASLLFVHQFYSSEGSAETSVLESGLSSAFEAAFGQISGMLTDLIKVVDVDMNYSRGSDGSSDRVDLNLSKDYGRVVVNANAGFSGRNDANSNQSDAIIGDAYVEYKMTENFRMRVFNRSNANDFTKYNIAPYTQGVGLFYHRQYDKFKDIFVRTKKDKKENL